jgi:hypothetical protein
LHHCVHDLQTPVAAHWLLTAGQDALVRMAFWSAATLAAGRVSPK